MDMTTSTLLTVILVILTCFLYKWLFPSQNYWKYRGIPSVPGGLPIFGNTLPIFLGQENLTTFCTKIYEKYRDKSMVGFYNLKTPVLMVKDPELVKTVLQTSFSNFHKNEATLDINVDSLIGYDPFFVQDYQDWKDARAIFNSSLSPMRIKIMSRVVTNVCKKLDDHLADMMGNKESIELEAKFLFSRYTAEVAAGCVFGIEGNSFMNNYEGTLLECMKITLDPAPTKSLFHTIVLHLPSLGKFLKTRFVPAKAATLFNNIVKDVENLRQKNDNPQTDVLQLMLDMVENGKIPKVKAVGHTFSFFLESYETSSLTLSFMAYFIAKIPKVQMKIRAEVATTLAKYEGQLTYEAINEMSYLDRVLNEAMRFYPAVGAIAKICVDKCRLEGSDGLAVDVEPGTAVYIPIRGLHMDPEIWENPEEFNPDRFEKGKNEGRHKFVFLPFSEGPRACPGQRFATLQVKAAIATILRNYSIQLAPTTLGPRYIDPSYFWVTLIGGYWIRIHPLINK